MVKKKKKVKVLVSVPFNFYYWQFSLYCLYLSALHFVVFYHHIAVAPMHCIILNYHFSFLCCYSEQLLFFLA